MVSFDFVLFCLRLLQLSQMIVLSVINYAFQGNVSSTGSGDNEIYLKNECQDYHEMH